MQKPKGYRFDGVFLAPVTKINGDKLGVCELIGENGGGMVHVFAMHQIERREGEPVALPDTTETATLRAELSAIQADLKSAAGELMVEYPQPHGSDGAKLIHANVLLRHERDQLKRELAIAKTNQSASDSMLAAIGKGAGIADLEDGFLVENVLGKIASLEKERDEARTKVNIVQRAVDIAEQIMDAQTDKQVELCTSFNEMIAHITLEQVEAENDTLKKDLDIAKAQVRFVEATKGDEIDTLKQTIAERERVIKPLATAVRHFRDCMLKEGSCCCHKGEKLIDEALSLVDKASLAANVPAAQPQTMAQRSIAAEEAFLRDIAKLRSEHEIVIVEKRCIPEGTKLVEAYETESEFVIIGKPSRCDDPESPEYHDCDAMGCSSLSHVVVRIPKAGANVPASDPQARIREVRERIEKLDRLRVFCGDVNPHKNGAYLRRDEVLAALSGAEQASEQANAKEEQCSNCSRETVPGAHIYTCEVCSKDCCTACTETTNKHQVICDECNSEAAQEGGR